MKKRLFALMMAGVLAFGGSICAFAEEAAVVVDYSMIDPDVYEGTWCSFFDMFDLYLPSDWSEIEVSEEDQADGIYYIAGDENTGNNVIISYVDSETPEMTVADLVEPFKEEFGDAEIWKVNDIDCIVFGSEDSNSMGLAALDYDGGYYQVTLTSGGEDDDFAWATNIVMSFSNHEEEAETE